MELTKKINVLCLIFSLGFSNIIFGSSDLSETSKSKENAKEQSESITVEITRPLSCPVREDIATYAEILGKLQSIRDSLGTNCEEEAKGQVEKLNSDLTQLESVATDTEIGSDAEQTAQVTQAFSTLGSIAAKSECYYNIRERGLLPVVSDVILDVSQIGLLIPDDQTIAYATTGYFLGTTLKILISVFRQKFDFENEGDRKNFLDLNCAFFDVRKAIDDSGFLLNKSQIITNELQDLEKRIPTLKEEFERAQKNVESFEKFYQDEQKAFISKEVSKEAQNLAKIHKELLTVVSGPAEGIFQQRMQLRSIAERIESIEENRFPFDLPVFVNEDFFSYLGLLNLIKYDYTNFFKMSVEEFNLKISEVVRYHGTWIIDYVKYLEQEANNKFSKTKVESELNTDDLNWADFYKKNLAVFQSKLDAKAKEFNTANARLEVLQDISTKEKYSFSDPGDNERIDILETYNDIVKIIYGKTGKRFLNYAHDASKKYIRSFNIAYKDFERNFVSRFEGDFSSLEALQACQNADYLIKAYNNTSYYSEVGHDFLMTNIRIFHDYVPKSRRVVVVPVGSSSSAYLQEQSVSMLYAKAVLQGQEISKKQRKDYLGRRSFGQVMLNIMAKEEAFQKVQDFWIVRNCDEKFQ